MTDRKKLSELISDFCEHVPHEEGQTWEEACAVHLIANGVTISEDTDVPEKWIKLLQKEYESAKKLHFVHNPIAYALYHVWKAADADKSEVRSRDKE